MQQDQSLLEMICQPKRTCLAGEDTFKACNAANFVNDQARGGVLGFTF